MAAAAKSVSMSLRNLEFRVWGLEPGVQGLWICLRDKSIWKEDFGCWRRVIYPVLAGASGNISLKAVCLYMAAHPCRERARGTQSDQTCFGFHIVVAATVCARTFGLRALNPEQTRNPNNPKP